MKTIDNSDYKVFIELLKEARISRNITQIELAKRLGTDQTYISKYETLERRLDLSELRAICKAIGISLTKFVQEYESKI